MRLSFLEGCIAWSSGVAVTRCCAIKMDVYILCMIEEIMQAKAGMAV